MDSVLGSTVGVAGCRALFCHCRRSWVGWPSVGLRNPIVAFVPFFGLWIVLFESIGRSGWLALLTFIPYVGWLLVPVWTGIELPAHHGRSRWWTAVFAVPILNLVGYWVYAFTLPRHVADSGPELQRLAA